MPSVLRAFALVSLLATAQDAPPRNFSGTWQAKVKDSVVCTLELRHADSITGAFPYCYIHTDSDGNLEPAEPTEGPEKPVPIANASVKGEVLFFEYKDEGESEPVKFEMRLVSPGAADLTIVNAPVKIKPIRFLRVPAKV